MATDASSWYQLLQSSTAARDAATCNWACPANSCAASKLVLATARLAQPTTRWGWLARAGNVLLSGDHCAMRMRRSAHLAAGSPQLPPRTALSTHEVVGR